VIFLRINIITARTAIFSPRSDSRTPLFPDGLGNQAARSDLAKGDSIGMGGGFV
jgi:hypothetical protein